MHTHPRLFLLCLAFSSLSFMLYGWHCLMSVRSKLEFIRYQVAGYRQMVGCCQLAGSIGLIVGLWLPALGATAALGLMAMMVLGLIVRIRLRDTLVQMLPATIYLLVNTYLAAGFLRV